jgi:hypothetical protein
MKINVEGERSKGRNYWIALRAGVDLEMKGGFSKVSYCHNSLCMSICTVFFTSNVLNIFSSCIGYGYN